MVPGSFFASPLTYIYILLGLVSRFAVGHHDGPQFCQLDRDCPPTMVCMRSHQVNTECACHQFLFMHGTDCAETKTFVPVILGILVLWAVWMLLVMVKYMWKIWCSPGEELDGTLAAGLLGIWSSLFLLIQFMCSFFRSLFIGHQEILISFLHPLSTIFFHVGFIGLLFGFCLISAERRANSKLRRLISVHTSRVLVIFLSLLLISLLFTFIAAAEASYLSLFGVICALYYIMIAVAFMYTWAYLIRSSQDKENSRNLCHKVFAAPRPGGRNPRKILVATAGSEPKSARASVRAPSAPASARGAPAPAGRLSSSRGRLPASSSPASVRGAPAPAGLSSSKGRPPAPAAAAAAPGRPPLGGGRRGSTCRRGTAPWLLARACRALAPRLGALGAAWLAASLAARRPGWGAALVAFVGYVVGAALALSALGRAGHALVGGLAVGATAPAALAVLPPAPAPARGHLIRQPSRVQLLGE